MHAGVFGFAAYSYVCFRESGAGLVDRVRVGVGVGV